MIHLISLLLDHSKLPDVICTESGQMLYRFIQLYKKVNGFGDCFDIATTLFVLCSRSCQLLKVNKIRKH